MEELVNIYSNDNIVYVNLPEKSEAQIEIYNNLGQHIFTSSLNEIYNTVALKEAGVYIVKVSLDGQLVSEKVLIQ